MTDLTTRYGYPPDRDKCKPVECPPHLRSRPLDAKTFDSTRMGLGVEALVGLGSATAWPRTIATRLRTHFRDTLTKGPIQVDVPGYGEFLIGEAGWSVS